MVCTHTDDELVDKPTCALNNVDMPIGYRVKGPRIETGSFFRHKCLSFFCCSANQAPPNMRNPPLILFKIATRCWDNRLRALLAARA